MIFAPIWSIGDWRVHKEAIVSFGPCSYPTQKLQTWKEAAWKCYTMALEEISISTTRVGRIYWLYGADANYDQHGDVVRVQARQIKISILGTYHYWKKRFRRVQNSLPSVKNRTFGKDLLCRVLYSAKISLSSAGNSANTGTRQMTSLPSARPSAKSLHSA